MHYKKWNIFLVSLISFHLIGCHSYSKDAPVKNLKAASSYNVQLGLGYLEGGKIERAKEKLLTALKENPESAVAFSAMGYFWESTGDPKSAEEYYLKAIQLAPNEGEMQNNYGAFLCRIQRYDEAEKYLVAAATNKHYLYTVSAYENLGLCALQAKNLPKARSYFQKVLDQDSLRERSLWEIANTEEKLGLNQEAYKHLQHLIALNVPSKAILIMAIRLTEKLNDVKANKQYQLQLKQMKDQ